MFLGSNEIAGANKNNHICCNSSSLCQNYNEYYFKIYWLTDIDKRTQILMSTTQTPLGSCLCSLFFLHFVLFLCIWQSSVLTFNLPSANVIPYKQGFCDFIIRLTYKSRPENILFLYCPKFDLHFSKLDFVGAIHHYVGKGKYYLHNLSILG